MNRRNLLKMFAALPAALIPGCFSPGLPASSFVAPNADVDSAPVFVTPAAAFIDPDHQYWKREDREFMQGQQWSHDHRAYMAAQRELNMRASAMLNMIATK
jgi:hypothetical protein